MGGKTQRLNGHQKPKPVSGRPVGRPPKKKRKSKHQLKKLKEKVSLKLRTKLKRVGDNPPIQQSSPTISGSKSITNLPQTKSTGHSKPHWHPKLKTNVKVKRAVGRPRKLKLEQKAVKEGRHGIGNNVGTSAVRAVGRPPKVKPSPGGKAHRLVKKRFQPDQPPSQPQTSAVQNMPRSTVQANTKPMSNRERGFAQKHAIFLVRNITRIRHLRKAPPQKLDCIKERDTDIFMTQLTSLNTDRSVKTRRLAMTEENRELAQIVHLAQVFKDIFTAVATYKDEDGSLLAPPLMSLPSRKRYPDYYELIEEPIDMKTIEKNIQTGQYKTVERFDQDFLKLFRNVERYCGCKSDMGRLVVKLRNVFYISKTSHSSRLEGITAEGTTHSSSTESEAGDSTEQKDCVEDDSQEEIIRCICGIYRDEGLMIQCDRCHIWQHFDCMGVETTEDCYLCEECDPRPVPKEILLVPQPDDRPTGFTYYMTLMREELQVHVGDCVYLMRDTTMKRNADGTPVRLSHRLMSSISPDKCDIFRIERLWKTEQGERFAFGHHYYRPHETYHEPSRKFYPNEVFRIPLYENISLDMVVAMCCVLDPYTFSKGRPKGVQEQDVYICEYRLDKTAHLFYKISRSPFPVNCKSYCFDRFEKKLLPKRTYSPHEVPESYRRRGPNEKSASGEEESEVFDVDEEVRTRQGECERTAEELESDSEEDLPLSQLKQGQRMEKKARLDRILVRLLGSIPGKQKVDLSYLLEDGAGKRPRKKPQTHF